MTSMRQKYYDLSGSCRMFFVYAQRPSGSALGRI